MSNELNDFEQDVLARSQQTPVLVDFWAPWCGPCRVLGPVLERLAAVADGRWLLVKVNTEEQPELAARFDIRSIPNVKLFFHGAVVDEFVGALPEGEVRRWLERAMPSPRAGQVAEARRLVEAGRPAEARALLEPVVAAEPTRAEARVLLASCLLGSEPGKIPDLTRPVETGEEWGDQARALEVLARVVLGAERPGEVPAGRGQAGYLEGSRHLRAGDFAAALAAFIQVLEQQHDYGGGAAKEACKAIFQFLGVRHPIAARFHRAFTSALYV